MVSRSQEASECFLGGAQRMLTCQPLEVPEKNPSASHVMVVMRDRHPLQRSDAIPSTAVTARRQR